METDSRDMKLTIVIPVYNERVYLPELFRRIRSAKLPPGILSLELIAVDDGSDDGSGEWLEEYRASHPELKLLKNSRNSGKGSCVRQAIAASTGDIVLIQDSDLEYHPDQYAKLLAPILSNEADAVLGSRFLGTPRRVLYFWHSVANHALTLLLNLLSNTTFSDFSTGFKVIRGDAARSLRLVSGRFGIEAELCARMAAGRLRTFEVPVSYSGRTYAEGKKISRWDAVAMVFHIIRFSVFGGTPFQSGMRQTLTALYSASDVLYAEPLRRLLRQIGADPRSTKRVLEVGSGMGSVTQALLGFDRIVATDIDPESVRFLRERYSFHPGFTAERWDATLAPDAPATPAAVSEGAFDLIIAFNVLEHLKDDHKVLAHWRSLLAPNGMMVILVPFGPRLYTPIDAAVGHERRYGRQQLAGLLEASGAEVLTTRFLNPMGILGWILNGKILRRSALPQGQVKLYSLIKPLVRPFEALASQAFGLSIVMAGRWK